MMKKIITVILSFAIIFWLLGIPSSTNAAAPTGSFTGTAITVNIGELKAINALTVTDNSATAEITAASDIRIRIPTEVDAEWDISDTTAELL